MMTRLLCAYCAVIAVAGITILAGEPQASASVADVFSVNPDPITAGEQSLLKLQLTLHPDPGDFNPRFTGGTVTLYDGLGDSKAFTIAPGLMSETFSQAFTYPHAGGFTPHFTVSASYSEYYSFSIVGYQQTGTKQWTDPLKGSLPLSVNSTPLPATWLLTLSGLLLLGFMTVRRVRGSAH